MGPVLGMAKRPYVEIIKGVDLVIPESILSQNLPPEAYDGRLPLSQVQIQKSNLAAYRRAAQQEEGLRTAFIGGMVVNVNSCLCFLPGSQISTTPLKNFEVDKLMNKPLKGSCGGENCRCKDE